MGLALENVPYYDNGGGLDQRSSPTKTPEDKATTSINIDYGKDGAIRTRWGSRVLNQFNQIPGTPQTLGLFPFIRTDGLEREVIAAGTDLYLGLGAPVAQGFALDPNAYPDFEYFATNNDEYMFYGNGVDTNLKYNGTTWTNWSIIAPIAPFNPVLAPNPGALLAGDYSYRVTYANYDALNGVVVQESPVSPALDVTVPPGPDQQVTIDIPVSADPQVNARIIYRVSPTSGAVPLMLAIIADNVTANYTDTNQDDVFETQANLDAENAPLTDIFCEYNNRMFMNDVTSRVDLRYSAFGTQGQPQPWNVPAENIDILDGRITAMHRFFGTLIVGTDRSIWVFSGDPDDVNFVRKRISSKIGILNNRCIVGESILYFMSTSRKVYALRPTDLTEDEIRTDHPLSDEVQDELNRISISQLAKTNMEYFTTSDLAKVYISYNIGAGNNQNLIVYNEDQSLIKQNPCWQTWNHIEPSILKQFDTSNNSRLIFGDFNGFLWRAEDSSIDGDGSEINGTATASTNNTLTDDRIPQMIEVASIATAGGAATLTDATQAWDVDEWQSEQLYIFAGTGAGQVRTIQSNTADTLTVGVAWGVVPDATSQYYIGGLVPNGHVGHKITIVAGTGVGQTRTITANTPISVTISTNWNTNPDVTSEYTIGGYETFHFSNWKYVLESYDALKQLWYIWMNANANGDYTITLIIQTDFDTTINNQENVLVNLSAYNSIWSKTIPPGFLWGAGIWGSRSVFQDRFRVYDRFRAIRIGFRHLKAGQPWQVNGFSVSCQNKRLFFASAP